MQKILNIPNYYPPHIGGIEDVCCNIVTGLPQHRHKVICFNDNKTTSKDVYDGVEIIRCGVWKQFFSQSVSFSYFGELREALHSFKPDIVHFHMPNPLISVYLLVLLPRKVRLFLHWHSDIIEQNWLHTFYAPIEKRLLKRAEKILVTSPTYVTGSKVLFPWENKILVLPNTVNINKLQKKEGDDEAIEKLKNKYDGKKIVFTSGRHVPYKGLKFLVDSVPLLPDDAAVVIAGKGPLSATLKERNASPALHFPGRISDDELRHYLYASDVFAFPSITRNEAFGVALAEAMYCGLPAVTFTIPGSGVNWVCVDGKTGIESENGNVQALSAAINKLFSDDNLRKSLGSNASIRVREKFTLKAIKEKLDNLYS